MTMTSEQEPRWMEQPMASGRDAIADQAGQGPGSSPDTLRRVIARAASRIITAADELTDLDRAIGDGDHGINMSRGMEAVLADLDSTVRAPLPDAMQAIGKQLVLSVGGASGPLFGTFFMAFGRALPFEALTRDDVARALDVAVIAVKARGRAGVGEKTLLDVLVPVSVALANGADIGTLPSLARACAANTVAMRAMRGRAAFLGDRSIGHMDPGARTVQLMVEAVVEVLTDGRGAPA